MTSLSEAYRRDIASRAGPRRLALGIGLVATGVLLLVAGIVAAGTEFLLNRGYGLGEARRLGGILGGLGVPAIFLGVFAVLPASRNTRAAAVIGALLAVFGVALFSHAYPCGWIGTTCDPPATDLTIPTVGVYFIGMLTTFWCMFIGIANFKVRNDPGGTVDMNVTTLTERYVVSSEEDSAGGSWGSVGLFGPSPDGDVETQTNTDRSSGTTATGTGATAGRPSPSSDGGADQNDISSPGTDRADRSRRSGSPVVRPSKSTYDTGSSAGDSSWGDASAGGSSRGGSRGVEPSRDSTSGADSSPGRAVGETDEDDGVSIDRYCGSCVHFEYRRDARGIKPYCSYHGEEMDDMEACEEWAGRDGPSI